MKHIAKPLTSDQVLILEHLKKNPKNFISGTVIAMQADNRERYEEDPRWPNIALFQLTEMKLLKTRKDGRYRLGNGLFTKSSGAKVVLFRL